MVRRRKNQKLSRRAIQRLLSRSNRGWVLDPVLSENEEWSECVRTKRQHDDEELTKYTEPDDGSEDFDD
jgi:hypothetical protein